MYDQKLGGEREERQRAEQAAVVRRQMAEFERNFRAKLGSCSAQVLAQLRDSVLTLNCVLKQDS